jgi:hypothetical protein
VFSSDRIVTVAITNDCHITLVGVAYQPRCAHFQALVSDSPFSTTQRL